MYVAEMLTEQDKGCGNLVTFSHMVVVAAFAALENFNWTTLQFRVRTARYFSLVLMRCCFTRLMLLYVVTCRRGKSLFDST